mmetsp:Transcript_6810/g.17110  ORF Transcript_6810/g.17110 Transcript_6810/m.17110 type:complete len:257 (-) Transcript_6810:764-1534(-)
MLVAHPTQRSQRGIQARVGREGRLGGEADARAVAAADVVGHTVCGGALVSQGDELRTQGRRFSQQALQLNGNGTVVRRVGGGRGQGVLERLGWRHPRPHAARCGAHVARGELVPRRRKRLLEEGDVLGKHLDVLDVLAPGVVQQADVGRQHHDALRAVHGAPLVLAAGADVHLPLVVQQLVEVVVVPACGVGGPGAVKPGRERVLTLAAAAHARPGVSGVLDRAGAGALGARAVGAAEGMATTNQGNSLHVVHVHV